MPANDWSCHRAAATVPALNVVLVAGGNYWDYNDKQYSLTGTWYSGGYLKPVALSADWRWKPESSQLKITVLSGPRA